MRGGAAFFAVLALAVRCKRHPQPAPVPEAGVADAGHGPLSTSPARRCGECHGKLEQEWRSSAHARAETSPAYLAMRGRARDDRCQSCHAPISGLVDADSPMRGEGVTCDACHAMREARAEPAGAAFVLNLRDNTKYGPLCDAKNHYFHKVGCSPMHGESVQCGGCHLFYGAGGVPVFTEYEEWAKSDYGATGVVCQDCHMPGSAEEIAIGAGKRPAVSNHGFMGSPDLRQHAVGWRVVVTGNEKTLHAEVELRNEGAGHALPTGMPGRRLALRARVIAVKSDQDESTQTDQAERVFARILVDDSGAEVPFYRAVRVASDSRLPAGAAHTETFDLNAPEQSGELELDLVRIDMAPAVSAALGLPPPAETAVLSARVPFGKPQAGGREKLPKVVSATTR